jgi:hypothetical protein
MKSTIADRPSDARTAEAAPLATSYKKKEKLKSKKKKEKKRALCYCCVECRYSDFCQFQCRSIIHTIASHFGTRRGERGKL